MQHPASPIGLSEEGCLQRQRRLVQLLIKANFDAAILADRQNIHLLTGYWTREVFQPLLLLRADGRTFLTSPSPPQQPAFVSQFVSCPSAPLGTLVDDQREIGLNTLREFNSKSQRCASDGFSGPQSDISPLIRSIRRTKLADEIRLLECGVRACDAVYDFARQNIQPGLLEWALYADCLFVAIDTVGEPIGELGNDFQSGTPGGPPRHRTMQEHELLPLDLSVVVRGYHSDLCRTFPVGNRPTAQQKDAHRRVLETLEFVAATVKPGASCRQLYEDASRMLKAHHGWEFPHHLGHGIGLSAHEAPRLNPNWNDFFQEGDVFTAEPGLYSPELRGGVRLEQDFVVTATGVRPLSTFPMDL
jgi:Xaa-Pro aminopeptidase